MNPAYNMPQMAYPDAQAAAGHPPGPPPPGAPHSGHPGMPPNGQPNYDPNYSTMSHPPTGGHPQPPGGHPMQAR